MAIVSGGAGGHCTMYIQGVLCASYKKIVVITIFRQNMVFFLVVITILFLKCHFGLALSLGIGSKPLMVQ